MTNSRMLISKYVSENRDEHRRIARACNIAVYFKENYARLEGNSISSKEVRKQIRFKLDPTLRNLKDSRTKEEINGDHRAHGDAWGKGKTGLRLSSVDQDGSRKIEFSMPNWKRCASYLLGKGPKVGAIKLIRDTIKEDNILIDSSMKTPKEELAKWEQSFVQSLNKKWRKKGLSAKQRLRLKQIIKNRF